MANNQSSKAGKGSTSNWKLWLRGLFRVIIIVGVMAGILFLAAGSIYWLAAWLLTFLYLFYLLFFIIWGFRNAPDLLQERGRMASNVKSWDKVINVIYAILIIILLITAGFDVVRYRWSKMFFGLQLVGMLGLILTGWLIWLTVAENTYASRWARIQENRRQVVISSGPYRYIRHPMYSAIILLACCLSLELGSWWGLIPSGLIGILFIIRTELEDRMLRKELTGYQEYVNQVQYRLIPGIW